MPNMAESDLLLIWKFICISSFSRIFTHMWTVQYSCTSLAADIGAFCLVDVPSLYVLPCLHLVNQILAVASSNPREDSCSKRCCLFGDRYLYLWASVCHEILPFQLLLPVGYQLGEIEPVRHFHLLRLHPLRSVYHMVVRKVWTD